MELRHTPRLYIATTLSGGNKIEIESEQAHYLRHVMRLKIGDVVRLFNERDGEWKAEVTGFSKRSATLALEKQTRQAQAEPDLWLCAAPIKKAHFEYMLEKATELGITVFQPILTSRTQIREVNPDRCRAIAIEAAEQSERLCIPEMRKPATLQSLMADWPAGRQLIVCAEWGNAMPVGKAALAANSSSHAAILTGPEGGLTSDELEILRKVPSAVFVRLGPRILRADTAAIAALACWQFTSGDWR